MDLAELKSYCDDLHDALEAEREKNNVFIYGIKQIQAIVRLRFHRQQKISRHDVDILKTIDQATSAMLGEYREGSDVEH